MRDVFMELLQPQIDERMRDRDRTNLYTYVQDGAMAIDYAARQANMTTDQFRQQMEEYNRAHSSQESLQTV